MKDIACEDCGLTEAVYSVEYFFHDGTMESAIGVCADCVSKNEREDGSAFGSRPGSETSVGTSAVRSYRQRQMECHSGEKFLQGRKWTREYQRLAAERNAAKIGD